MSEQWLWQCDPVSAWTEPHHTFDTQADAEQWLSATWEDLASAGVSAVTLMNGTTVAYGPMSLQELS